MAIIADKLIDKISKLLTDAGIQDSVLCFKDPDSTMIYHEIRGSTIWCIGAGRVLEEKALELHDLREDEEVG